MALIVNAGEPGALARLGRQQTHWAYNALDCCVPQDILAALLPKLTKLTERIYAFERACQAPAMAMMRRGVRVNPVRHADALGEARKDLRHREKAAAQVPEVREVWDGTEIETGLCKKSTRKDGRHKWPRGVPDSPDRRCETCGAARVKPSPFNANSHTQTARLLHDLLGIPRQKNSKGEWSVDESVLDRIGRKWDRFRKLTDAILEVRGAKKQIGFLKSIKPDLWNEGRARSSFNVGQAWTGRWSSSKDPFQRGTNLQNIAEKHRRVFVADPGYDLGYADLEQAESRTVAYIAGDEAYIAAHEEGNVHVVAARVFWPDHDWTGDPKLDKKFCKETPLPWDPDHTYYDNSKRNQHGLNYGLTPMGLAQHTHQPLYLAKLAYERYFDWAPGIKTWQLEVARTIRDHGVIVTPLGRPNIFFGRPWDKHTIRQAIAFVPQSTVADVLNIALWLVWKEMDPGLVQLLAQVHDAILFQFPRGQLEAVRGVTQRMTLPIPVGEREMVIPVEVTVGRNWGHQSESNPDGLKEVEV